MCLQSTWEARSPSKSGVTLKIPVCLLLLWYGESIEWCSKKKQGHVEKQENALSELIIGGSAVDSLNCSSVAIFT